MALGDNMNKGELHKTPNNQHRAILGITPDGGIVFATRGGNVPHDYDSCQVQSSEKFEEEAEYVGVIPTPDFQRIEEKFKNYTTSKNAT
jgi:hypothetical protein